MIDSLGGRVFVVTRSTRIVWMWEIIAAMTVPMGGMKWLIINALKGDQNSVDKIIVEKKMSRPVPEGPRSSIVKSREYAKQILHLHGMQIIF